MPLQRSNTDIAGPAVQTVRSTNADRPFSNTRGLVKQGYISDLKIRRIGRAHESFYEVHLVGWWTGNLNTAVIPLSWLRTPDGRTFDHLKPTDPKSIAADKIKAVLMGKRVKAFMGGPIAPLRDQPPRTAGKNDKNPYAQIQYAVLNVPETSGLLRNTVIGSSRRPPGPGGFVRSNTV